MRHDDTDETRDYAMAGGYIGTETRTYCGLWLCSCEDDERRWRPEVWAYATGEPVTCPDCLRLLDEDDRAWQAVAALAAEYPER